MNTMKRVKLHRLREKIVQDLDVKDIIEYLLNCGAINEEDCQAINSERERTDQTRHLLDLLPQKDFEAFDHFVESLKKDYDWLYKEFSDGSSETDSADEKTFYADAFLLGGVPYPPPYNVQRLKKLNETREKLRILKRGHFVVLHGMTGSGKSCLAAAAIDNNILMGSFKGSVYWLTLGEYDEEELLSQMIQLLTRLELSNNMRHISTHIVDKIPINKARAKEELKRYFLEESFREGLLILDDLTSDKQLDAFDIGCKIMVTAKDLLEMSAVKSRCSVIQVSDGLTENESLSLLAQSIDIPMDQLPKQAKVIHSLSQGSPMTLALIAGQLEENRNDAIHSSGRWQYYVNMLSQKTFGPMRRNSFLEQNGLFQTISMSINSLPSNKKELYIDFVLFMEDVNIKPEVLQTLWEMETKYEVENVMAYFTKKSLAVCKWNEQFKSSVYGIHDLLLHYLKDQVSCEQYTELHRKLLRRYHNKCNGQYATLPNDNYIYSYIGYHMYHAGEWQLFETIFLDLKFIQSKLKVTGPADVIGDFRKYKNQIINENADNNEKINDIIKFIQAHGLDLFKYHNLDIVQSGLLWKKGSWVYNEAYKIAKNSEEKLYFKFMSYQDLVSHPITLPLPEEIVSACFTNEINKILVSDGKGIIKLWRLDPVRSIKTFRGHHFKVSHLELHPDNRRFLSCSDDGSLKLWSLDHCEVNERIELNISGDNLRVSSPANLQKNWTSMFLDDSPKDESLRTYQKHKNAVLSAKFSHSGNEVVSCCKDSFIVWDVEKGISRFTIDVEGDNMATCCTFSWDDSRLFLGDNCKINIYDNKTTESLGSFRNSSKIISVLSVPFDSNKVIIISTEEVQIWEWDEPEISNPVKDLASVATFSLGKISQHSFGKKKFDYVCASISNDGTYLVTASSDHIISVYDLKTETVIAEHKNYSGIARCLDTYVKDSTPLLLCGSDDRTVKIWHLDQSSTVSSVNLLPCFDSTWIWKNEWQPIVAMPDSKNRVQILRGNELLQDTPEESQQILVCSLACSGCCVFYGCADGQVKMYSIDNGSGEAIMKLDDKVTYIQCFQNFKNLLLVAAGDNTRLKIWKQDTTVVVCYGQTGPVVRSFLVPNTELLLACNEDASVKLWDVGTGDLRHVLTGRLSKASIKSADISEQFNVMVLTNAINSFLVSTLALHKDSPYISVTSVKTKNIGNDENTALQCCRISPGGNFVALGLYCGEILVWNLKNLQLVKKLKLHTSPVRDILFTTTRKCNIISQNLDLLVTIGEKIGWWNVTDLLNDSPSDVNNSLTTNATYNGRDWEIITQQREGSFKKDDERDPLLFGCVKLVGSHALKIACSPDSLSFVTVDTSGIFYLLKLLH